MRKLSGAMSFEIGQPLSIIAGYARLLQDVVNEETLARNYLSNAVLQIGKIEDVLRKIESIAQRLENHGHRC
jgi:signal transduction histidine kinase